MIGQTCPKCDHIGHPTCAVGIFRPDGPTGYRAAYDDAPIRDTRAEAEGDACARRLDRPAPRAEAPQPAPRRTEEPARPEPAPFPAATMETAARAKAWRDFLAQIQLSLMVWEIDGEVRAGCEHVLAWMRCCRDDLDALMPAQGVLL